MSKSKILNRKEIEQLLKEGNLLSWNSILAETSILDREYNVIGKVRLDTFLKLRKELNFKRFNIPQSSRELYVLD